MNTLENRVALLCKTLKLTQSEFAKELGLTQSTVSGWTTGKSKFTESNIRLICFTFHVSEHWLRTGEGQMFTSEDPDTTEFLEIYRVLSPPFRKMFLEYGRFLIEQQNSMSIP
jgi:transcriptional regulator with XRE-family HTH domain